MTIRRTIALTLLLCTAIGLWGAIDHGVSPPHLAIALVASVWNLYWARVIYKSAPRINSQGS